MRKYKHIFFDLDHTLWDYDSNVKESLAELYETYQLQNVGIANFQSFLVAFYAVNFKLWALYDLGEVDKKRLRETRFKLIFENAGANPNDVPTVMEDDFLHRTSSKKHLLPYAKEILEYLKPHYKMHIITNGFNESQSIKMNASGLTPYFDLLVTSETTGHKKPDPRIFHYALSNLSIEPHQVVMIGDNPTSDILGAKRSNIDQIYFDPDQKGIDFIPTHTIGHLKELEGLL